MLHCLMKSLLAELHVVFSSLLFFTNSLVPWGSLQVQFFFLFSTDKPILVQLWQGSDKAVGLKMGTTWDQREEEMSFIQPLEAAHPQPNHKSETLINPSFFHEKNRFFYSKQVWKCHFKLLLMQFFHEQMHLWLFSICMPTFHGINCFDKEEQTIWMYTNETLTRPKHFAKRRGRDRETKTPFFPDYSAAARKEEELLRASKPIDEWQIRCYWEWDKASVEAKQWGFLWLFIAQTTNQFESDL